MKLPIILALDTKEIEVAETFDKPTLAKVPSEAKSSEPIKPKFDVNQIIKNLNF